MNLVDQRNYILRLSTQLEQFSQVRPDLWDARCPVCGDSKKNATKKRFYIYRKKNSYSVKCHNCGYVAKFMTFFKTRFPLIYNQTVVEKYLPEDKKPKVDKKVVKRGSNKPVNLTNFTSGGYDYRGLTPLSQLPEAHPAVQYVLERQIPKKWFTKHLLYCSDFAGYLEEIGEKKRAEKYKDYRDKRIIIPFYQANGESTIFQGRSLDDNCKLRYISIKKYDDADKVWGLDRIDPTLPVITIEGPIDAMFLPNTIAMGGSRIKIDADLKLIYILDNEPYNKDICNIYKKFIKEGKTVSFFPRSIKQKDINQMILAGYTPKQLVKIIFENRCNGIIAKMRLNEWRKR